MQDESAAQPMVTPYLRHGAWCFDIPSEATSLLPYAEAFRRWMQAKGHMGQCVLLIADGVRLSQYCGEYHLLLDFDVGSREEILEVLRRGEATALIPPPRVRRP